MAAPQWFIDLVEEIKTDLGIDASLAKTIGYADRSARLKAAASVDFSIALKEAVTDNANPDMIDAIWQTIKS